MDVTNVVKPGMDAWTEYGFAGLFVFVFLVVLFYTLLTIRGNKNEVVALTVKCTDCITQANMLKQEQISVLRELTQTVSQGTQQNREFLAYMHARDQFFGAPQGGQKDARGGV